MAEIKQIENVHVLAALLGTEKLVGEAVFRKYQSTIHRMVVASVAVRAALAVRKVNPKATPGDEYKAIYTALAEEPKLIEHQWFRINRLIPLGLIDKQEKVAQAIAPVEAPEFE